MGKKIGGYWIEDWHIQVSRIWGKVVLGVIKLDAFG